MLDDLAQILVRLRIAFLDDVQPGHGSRASRVVRRIVEEHLHERDEGHLLTWLACLLDGRRQHLVVLQLQADELSLL